MASDAIDCVVVVLASALSVVDVAVGVCAGVALLIVFLVGCVACVFVVEIVVATSVVLIVVA